MSNLLYKGISENTGEWVKGYGVCVVQEENLANIFHKQETNLMQATSIIPDSVCRFVGVTNDIELFEGDIVRENGCYIVWDTDLLCWCFQHVGDEIKTPLFYDNNIKMITKVYGNINDSKLKKDV